MRGILTPLTGVALLVGFWWVMSLHLEPVRLPSPSTVFTAFIGSPFKYRQIAFFGGGNAGFGPHLIYTLRTYAIGVSLGVSSGLIFGLLIAWHRIIRDSLMYPVELLRTIPSLAMLPFFLMWFGPNEISQIALVVLYCFPMVLINTTNAVRNVNTVYLKYARTLGADRWQVFRTILIPAIVPELIGGVRVALAVSWGLVVVAEFMGSQYGVGKLTMLFIPFFHTTGIFVGILWILLFATLTDVLFIQLSGPIIRWLPREQ